MERHKCTHTHLDQFLSDFIAEHARIHFLQIFDARLDLRRGHFWFRTTNHTRSNGAGLLVAIQYFRYATMWYT